MLSTQFHLLFPSSFVFTEWIVDQSKKMNNNTALITSADGFIGSHLTEILVAEGYQVMTNWSSMATLQRILFSENLDSGTSLFEVV